MAGIYKRGGTYYGRIQRGGKDFRTSLATADRRSAQRRFEEWAERIKASAWGERPRVTFNEAVKQFMEQHFASLKPKSAKRYAQSLKWLADKFEGRYLDEINRAALTEFEAERRTAGAQSPTIRRDLACLSSLLSFCEDREWIGEGGNPVRGFVKSRSRRGLKEGDPRRRWYTLDEEARLLAAARPQLAGAIAIAIDTGLREQELFSLTWPQIDFEGRVIRTTRDTKSRRARTVPLSERSAQILAQLQTANQGKVVSPFVFTTKRGRRLKNLYRGFKATAARACVNDATWHDLRRTAGCRWLQLHKKRMEEVSLLLGHSSIAVTERSYAFLEAEKIANETAQFPAQGQRIREA